MRSRRGFVLGVPATFAALAANARPPGAAQYSWKFGWPINSDHPVFVRAVEAFGKIRRETDGAVDVRGYANSVLGSGPAMTEQLRLGALEMEAASGGTFDTVVQVAGIESVSYAFPDKKTVFAAMDGDLGKAIRGDFPAKGFIGFEKIADAGFRHFTTYTKPIHTVADLQGVKLRGTPGKLFLDTLRSLGASPTAIASSELYTALQTHLIDGAAYPLPIIDVQRLYEVQRYCGLSHHEWAGVWFMVNRQKWESLPSKYQDVITKHINEAAVLERRDTEIQEISVKDKLRRLGLTFNDVDVASLKARLVESGYYGRWRNEYGVRVWDALEKYAGPLR